MPLDINQALNSYGFVGQLANAIPELRGILEQAVRDGWVPEQVDRAIQDSPWWKTNAEAVRNQARLHALDPATFDQNRHNAAVKIQLIARQMGRDPGDWNATLNLGMQALLGNWDEEQIRTYVGANLWAPQQDGAYVGDAGQLESQLRGLVTNYGVAATKPFIDGMITGIQSGQGTLEGFENVIKARAKAQYPHLAGQIDAGMTVRDIADPYIANYAQTLEVAESTITLNDPKIQQALQVRGADGSLSSKPMHEFVRQLKDDPRWDKTKNAEDEAYRFTNRLGKDMGFIS